MKNINEYIRILNTIVLIICVIILIVISYMDAWNKELYYQDEILKSIGVTVIINVILLVITLDNKNNNK